MRWPNNDVDVDDDSEPKPKRKKKRNTQANDLYKIDAIALMQRCRL